MTELPDYASIGFSGNPGTPKDHNRFNMRWKMLFAENQHAIRDKVVVDLACNNGRMSYPCIMLGAKKVIGLEARQSLVDEGKATFDRLGVADRMEWNQGDLFDFLAGLAPGSVDTILCLGFLYHTTRQIDFFREVRRIAPRYAIIDTSVVRNYTWIGRSSLFKKPPALFMYQDNADKTSDTTDADGLVYWPSKSFLETMFDKIGYKWREIDYGKGVTNWDGLPDYKRGIRTGYIGERV